MVTIMKSAPNPRNSVTANGTIPTELPRASATAPVMPTHVGFTLISNMTATRIAVTPSQNISRASLPDIPQLVPKVLKLVSTGVPAQKSFTAAPVPETVNGCVLSGSTATWTNSDNA